MKFSDLKNKFTSLSFNSENEVPSSTLKEIEEKYLGDIHGGSSELSMHDGFNKNIVWAKAF